MNLIRLIEINDTTTWRRIASIAKAIKWSFCQENDSWDVSTSWPLSNITHQTRAVEGEIEHLIKWTELNVVADDDVHIVQVEALQALIHTACHPLCAEIKPGTIPTALGWHHKTLSRDGHAFKCLPENSFGQRVAIVPVPSTTKDPLSESTEITPMGVSNVRRINCQISWKSHP